MIPAIPSGLYLADAEVITSTLSIVEAAISLTSDLIGLPSTNILTSALPLSETSPS